MRNVAREKAEEGNQNWLPNKVDKSSQAKPSRLISDYDATNCEWVPNWTRNLPGAQTTHTHTPDVTNWPCNNMLNNHKEQQQQEQQQRATTWNAEKETCWLLYPKN